MIRILHGSMSSHTTGKGCLAICLLSGLLFSMRILDFRLAVTKEWEIL